jgi:cytochrome c-type biogenesis protein CcmH
MGLIAVAALFVGLTGDDGPRTTEERASALSETVRCPTCQSQSVAESEAPVAREIRADIADRIEAGETDDEIRDYLVSRYSQEVLLTPPASGIAGLVWVIPVVAVAGALIVLVFAFRRWRDQPTVHATDADRELVEAALNPDEGDG